MIVQGTTAWLLLRRSTHMASGESVVVHAAAGGVGSVAVQLAKAWGAGRVIATASSPQKRELALELGADVAIDSQAQDMTAAIREANGGKRVDVILVHSTTIAGMWLPHAFRLPGNVVGQAMSELFELAIDDQLRVVAGGEYALADARLAHEALRSRGTTGKLVLNPQL